jgi:hypothetical protein
MRCNIYSLSSDTWEITPAMRPDACKSIKVFTAKSNESVSKLPKPAQLQTAYQIRIYPVAATFS